MARDTTIQRVQARRISRSRMGRAEVFTIGPRKALMEQLEARAAINRELFVQLVRPAVRQS